MRRLLAAILVAVLTGGVAAPLACAGWEPAAADRMACCTRAAHTGYLDQSAADDCCARHEQSRQPGSTMTGVPQPAPAPVVLALWVPAFDSTVIARTSATLFERSIARRLHGPPGQLALPLRI